MRRVCGCVFQCVRGLSRTHVEHVACVCVFDHAFGGYMRADIHVHTYAVGAEKLSAAILCVRTQHPAAARGFWCCVCAIQCRVGWYNVRVFGWDCDELGARSTRDGSLNCVLTVAFDWFTLRRVLNLVVDIIIQELIL